MIRPVVISTLSLLICFLSTSTLYSKDLGVLGTTFEIIEIDLETHFTEQLKALDKQGRLEAIQRDMVETAKERIYQPSEVMGLSPATQARQFYWDPTVIAPQDYKDHEGRIVAAKGTQANPLDYVKMRQDLIFLDGRRPEEVKWALEAYKDKQGLSKLVLIAGRPFDLMKEHKVRFYFDQRGLLSERFGLRKTPSKISQEGRLLLIEEIVVQ